MVKSLSAGVKLQRVLASFEQLCHWPQNPVWKNVGAQSCAATDRGQRKRSPLAVRRRFSPGKGRDIQTVPCLMWAESALCGTSCRGHAGEEERERKRSCDGAKGALKLGEEQITGAKSSDNIKLMTCS
mmetsp:Transcript_2813/g.8592  ORF Transcript_2813/g.8592 Transcript_2813/m.8592 type:complete len:128 (+) Transcript_2813:862-1245(+)